MTVSEAADKWGIPHRTIGSKLRASIVGQDKIDDWINRGLIKCYKSPSGKRKEWIISSMAMFEWFGKNEKN